MVYFLLLYNKFKYEKMFQQKFNYGIFLQYFDRKLCFGHGPRKSFLASWNVLQVILQNFWYFVIFILNQYCFKTNRQNVHLLTFIELAFFFRFLLDRTHIFMNFRSFILLCGLGQKELVFLVFTASNIEVDLLLSPD